MIHWLPSSINAKKQAGQPNQQCASMYVSFLKPEFLEEVDFQRKQTYCTKNVYDEYNKLLAKVETKIPHPKHERVSMDRLSRFVCQNHRQTGIDFLLKST